MKRRPGHDFGDSAGTLKIFALAEDNEMIYMLWLWKNSHTHFTDLHPIPHSKKFWKEKISKIVDQNFPLKIVDKKYFACTRHC